MKTPSTLHDAAACTDGIKAGCTCTPRTHTCEAQHARRKGRNECWQVLESKTASGACSSAGVACQPAACKRTSTNTRARYGFRVMTHVIMHPFMEGRRPCSACWCRFAHPRPIIDSCAADCNISRDNVARPQPLPPSLHKSKCRGCRKVQRQRACVCMTAACTYGAPMHAVMLRDADSGESSFKSEARQTNMVQKFPSLVLPKQNHMARYAK